ncbi:MAG: protein kinase [Deltaproteobacteria bacterium]|nr:protein kinase [Deltaproteobacteria bacterium]
MKTLDDIKPGQTIGRYEFLVPIAKGGMAAVWAARLKGSRGFSKTVAIKTMLPSLSDDPLFEEMFLDEAQIAAQIHHPNVVEIMDLGEEQDVLYIVMEYIDGESLATILRAVAKKHGGIPLPIAVQMMADACSGVHAAHELKNVDGKTVGLVHRDISPQNILTTYDGVVKLVDFGVAKAAGRTSSETTAGQIKGKAPYMSPEQAMGHKVDRRTDIFAMGIVLYQVTTGKHPFRGESDVATLHNILHRTVPSPRFVDPKYPRPLEAVLQKALNRDPEKRFQTAAEMSDALGRVFPPTVRRVTVSDVSKYVQELLGDIGDKRREALRDAIRSADARASSGSTEIVVPAMVALSDIETGMSSASGQQKVLMAPTERVSAVSDPGGVGFAPGMRPAPDGQTEVMSASSTSNPTAIAYTSPGSSPTGSAVAPEPIVGPEVAAPRPRRKTGLMVGIGIAVVAIAVLAIAGVKVTRGRGAVATSPGTALGTSSATTSAAPPASVASAPASDAGPQSFDLEAISHPVADPTQGGPVESDNTGLNFKGPEDKKKHGKFDGGVPSGWKPPPVTDPGF